MLDLPRKILNIRRYKAGYEIRTEDIDNSEYGGSGIVMKSAYTPSGDYIGNPKTAYRLCKKMGIAPEKRSPNHNVCSIGFSEKENKWFGWSHRSIYGFTIGSKIKKGDCGYEPKDPQDMADDMIRFWVDGDNTVLTNVELDVKDPYGQQSGLGVLVETKTECVNTKNKHLPGKTLNSKYWEPYPDVWGKGEWEAKTMEDTKQMAIDFAEGVS